MLEFVCPRCRRPFLAQAELVGKWARCPRCDHASEVPAPETENGSNRSSTPLPQALPLAPLAVPTALLLEGDSVTLPNALPLVPVTMKAEPLVTLHSPGLP